MSKQFLINIQNGSAQTNTGVQLHSILPTLYVQWFVTHTAYLLNPIDDTVSSVVFQVQCNLSTEF